MPVNTPASWSAHVLRMWLGVPSGPAALRGLTHLNVLLTAATEKESSTVLGNRPCQWHCVILKAGEEGVQLVQKQDVGVSNVAGFPFVVRCSWFSLGSSSIYLYVHILIPSLYLDLCVLGGCCGIVRLLVRYCCTVGTRSTSISLHSQ